MDETVWYHIEPSPLGDLLLTWDGTAITSLQMGRSFSSPEGTRRRSSAPASIPTHWQRDAAPFREACGQLSAYFAGARTDFDLPLAPKGTPFQQRVWDALREIPYGATESYGAVALRVGSPGAGRAVGSANGCNPIAIVVPCHRVIGADGSLTGYGGGLERKTYLLDLERANSG